MSKFSQALDETFVFAGLLPVRTSKLAFDKTGELYAGGEFTGTLTFGTMPLTATGKDIFITSYDGTGAVLSVRSFGGQGDQSLASLALDKGHHLLMAGSYTGEAHFGTVSVADGAFYVAKLDSAGAGLWADSFGSATLDTINRLAVTPSNETVIVGGFRSPTVTFGSQTLTNLGGTDAFIAVLAP